jgi:hypothetical protein
MSNEQQFFKDLLMFEKVEYSAPLTKEEVHQIYFDVASKSYPEPLLELVRRIENAHGIGVKDARPTKT